MLFHVFWPHYAVWHGNLQVEYVRWQPVEVIDDVYAMLAGGYGAKTAYLLEFLRKLHTSCIKICSYPPYTPAMRHKHCW